MERVKEFLKKVPWSMVILVVWMIVSQYFAMQLVIVPAVMALLGTLFVPVLLPVFLILIIAPGVFSLASWVALLFRRKILAAILSGMALLIGGGSAAVLNWFFNEYVGT
ncbi:MAG: hypothetical protein IPN96_09615 [Anaerolineales bacterium]|nr:hypothetical protein [Anaerolineales bacterium]MBK8824392.1 hypothetical protein [Anaerolineales bacterium]